MEVRIKTDYGVGTTDVMNWIDNNPQEELFYTSFIDDRTGEFVLMVSEVQESDVSSALDVIEMKNLWHTLPSGWKRCMNIPGSWLMKQPNTGRLFFATV